MKKTEIIHMIIMDKGKIIGPVMMMAITIDHIIITIAILTIEIITITILTIETAIEAILKITKTGVI